jgi:hypothetical protein
LDTLNVIKSKLGCGHISISGNKCNYFINDKDSLINVVIPIFNYVKLNSSKYFQYLVFEKAVNIVKSGLHLSNKGKLDIINCYHEIINVNSKAVAIKPVSLTNNWLIGFTEGDATFSTNKYVPRLKFENNIKEIELFNMIKVFLGSGNIHIGTPRNKANGTVTLEINTVDTLINFLIPLYNNGTFWTKKGLDFKAWSNLVRIYYFGYHTTTEGSCLFNEIKSSMNNFRLSTNKFKVKIDEAIIQDKLSNLFSKPPVYDIRNGIRFLAGTDVLVTERLKIVVVDSEGNKSIFPSINSASIALNLGRKTIKDCILSNKEYKGLTFHYDRSAVNF